ncbi:MAG TPA: 16S rRNA (adenine(1518)-N(6)/adenine(1519)-N(6))-dimethyltransferase RsmA [Candidatus Paceibacterota bacterium]|nr:16S rRNA (adenine(1518)-N(6)/adenine(1519)-N(6))-dimethyltransferase RsmA [Candidatus Paceibacterota bacterium]
MLKKKSLGQHFLTSQHYVGMIADAANIAPNETVLEIGPGEGALTRELLARGANVVAIEKDRRLIPVLQETFAKEIAEERLLLIEADVLEFDPANVPGAGPYKLVANIPYYITGAILEKFLSAKRQPQSATLLVQKEVAERIAREKKESILSLSVKAYGAPKYIKTVPAGAFSPPPSVDSAILAVEEISRKNFSDEAHEKRFFELVHAGFAHKRKLLASNLESTLGAGGQTVLERVGIPEKARAEDIELTRWVRLSCLGEQEG